MKRYTILHNLIQIFDTTSDVGMAVPSLSEAQIRVSISTNNSYLDHGIWPVSPLADPNLYLYFQSLPIRYRYGKNILRAYLSSRNFPPTLFEKKSNDGFEGFFHMTVIALMKRLQESLITTSVLAANNLLDKEKLKEEIQYADTHLDDESGKIALFNLYRFVCLELILKSMGVIHLPLQRSSEAVQVLK